MNNRFRAIFFEKTEKPLIQFVRYAIVGGIAFVVDAGTLFLLTRIPFLLEYYILPVTVAFLSGLAVNYLLSIIWVFRKRSMKNKYSEFSLFSLIGVIGLGLNYLIIWLFTEFVFSRLMGLTDKSLGVMLSKIIATIAVFLWNFFLRKLILFRERTASE